MAKHQRSQLPQPVTQPPAYANCPLYLYSLLLHHLIMMSQSQLSFASSNEIDPAILASFEAPTDLNWEGQRWVRVDHLPNQRKGGRSRRCGILVTSISR
jgi:hypothetical protein